MSIGKTVKKRFEKFVEKQTLKYSSSNLSQKENDPFGEKYITPGMGELCRRAGAEGTVILKNDGVLPLKTDKTVAVFGRCQYDWFYVGYGSGGDVHAPYNVSFMDGLENLGAAYDKDLAKTYKDWCTDPENVPSHGWWGHWPRFYPEMPLDNYTVKRAALNTDTALVVIGRAAGEARENVLEEGSWYLTGEEKNMLDKVTRFFKKTVVILDTGNIIDMGWTENYSLSAIVLPWQCGMESGNALCDVLYGKVNPSGRLAATIARSYEDYPSADSFGGKLYNEYDEDIYVGYRWFESFAPKAVLWPFGFGLSYTEFKTEPVALERTGDRIEVSLSVTNTGALSGRETVLLWCALPEGELDKPVRILAAFGKTKELAPGESCELALTTDYMSLSSYSDTVDAYILEPGDYTFEANGVSCGGFKLAKTTVCRWCESVCSREVDLKKRILDNLPAEIPQTHGDKWLLSDVKSGKTDLDTFIAQLSDTELESITRGAGTMDDPHGISGNAGTFGGVCQSLIARGVRPVVTTDGPAGIRINRYTSLLPCGTALACSFDTELTETLYALIGGEMKHYGTDVLLGPGMNIQRNPLCGRNFEYYSEDPLLSGKMAAAAVRGIQSAGVSACPKHFACNNQETNRNINDSRVSERALREIYLRNFEICVKEGKPDVIMTSYNKVNGVWSHYNYDLATTLLRREWGYEGLVITDWWMQYAKSPEFPEIRDNGYRIRAGVDVLMPGGKNFADKSCDADNYVLQGLKNGTGTTRGELQLAARHVLTFVLKHME